MKRSMVLFALIILLASALNISVSAEEYTDPMDSRYIPPQILELIDEEETVLLVRFYVAPMHFFKHRTDEGINHIINYFSGATYAQITETDINYYALLEDGELIKKERKYPDHYDQRFDYRDSFLHEFQIGDAIRSISPDIIIRSVYFLSGKAHYTGSAIFYKTNLGNYVYFSDNASAATNNLLFSEDAFWEYQEAYYATKNSMADGGAGSSDLWDLSAYDYHSPNFNPNAPFPKMDTPSPDTVPNTTSPTFGPTGPTKNATDPLLLWGGISTGAVLLVGVTVFCIIRRKRTAAK